MVDGEASRQAQAAVKFHRDAHGACLSSPDRLNVEASGDGGVELSAPPEPVHHRERLGEGVGVDDQVDVKHAAPSDIVGVEVEEEGVSFDRRAAEASPRERLRRLVGHGQRDHVSGQRVGVELKVLWGQGVAVAHGAQVWDDGGGGAEVVRVLSDEVRPQALERERRATEWVAERDGGGEVGVWCVIGGGALSVASGVVLRGSVEVLGAVAGRCRVSWLRGCGRGHDALGV